MAARRATGARFTTTKSTAAESCYGTRAKLWRWQGGKGSWHFMTLPVALAEVIRLVDAGPRRIGFGSLRVAATIGKSTWQTSIFPSAEARSYLLPVKAAVRNAENLREGQTVALQLSVRRGG
jgi:hypothetical protein